jgi:hypothetical protein
MLKSLFKICVIFQRWTQNKTNLMKPFVINALWNTGRRMMLATILCVITNYQFLLSLCDHAQEVIQSYAFNQSEL